jgi:hypothetical protein
LRQATTLIAGQFGSSAWQSSQRTRKKAVLA